jgi:hypothetical protein
MVPAQTDDLRADLALKLENRVDASLGVRASVHVVAEEYHGVVPGDLEPNLAENVREGRKIAVDVADRDCGHVD